jgi:hypothetical protein
LTTSLTRLNWTKSPQIVCFCCSPYFGIISVVASLPVPANSETSLSPNEARYKDALATAIHLGKSPAEIALQLYPRDKKARRAETRRIKRLVLSDQDLQRRVGERAQAEMIWGLGVASRGLVRAAGRGRTEAIKLLFEATGFHVTKQKHEHSGEIKVKLDIPRPPVLDDEGRPEPVVDADAVED